ncbi:hypothetical protein MPSEU_000929200 [Mayamaea pseudoterrestris]|nr:hypothetical protein MPSEU_000929200 [Mayamaea pseudoterrestris]
MSATTSKLTLDRVATDASITVNTKMPAALVPSGRDREMTKAKAVTTIPRADDIIIEQDLAFAARNIELTQHPGNIKFRKLIVYYRSLLETVKPDDPNILVDKLFLELNNSGHRVILGCFRAKSRAPTFTILPDARVRCIIRKELNLSVKDNGTDPKPTRSLVRGKPTIVTPFSSPANDNTGRVHGKTQECIPVDEYQDEKSGLKVSRGIGPSSNFVKDTDGPVQTHTPETITYVPKGASSFANITAKNIPYDLDYVKGKLADLVRELTDPKSEGETSDVVKRLKAKKGTKTKRAKKQPKLASATLRLSFDIDEEAAFERVVLNQMDVIVGRTCKSALHYCTRGHAGNDSYRRLVEHTSRLLNNAAPDDHSYLIRALFSDVLAVCGRFVRMIKQDKGVQRRTMDQLCSVVSDKDVLIVIQLDLSLLACMPVVPLATHDGATATTWISSAQIRHLLKKHLKSQLSPSQTSLSNGDDSGSLTSSDMSRETPKKRALESVVDEGNARKRRLEIESTKTTSYMKDST